MNNRMTVGELKEKLNKFEDTMIVDLTGGECGLGEWAELVVGKMVNHERRNIKNEVYNSLEFEPESVIMEY